MCGSMNITDKKGKEMGVRNRIYDYTDKRMSVKYFKEQEKRRRARQLAEKLIGKNYFTNMQEVMLQSAIELSERKR
jgi:hypothetical protein